MKKIMPFITLLAAIILQSCATHKDLASLKSRRLSSLSYHIEDPSIASILITSSQKSLIKKGRRYNEKQFDKQLGKERKRLAKLIQGAGVQDFDIKLISFMVNDTTGTNQYAVETFIDKK